MILLEIKAEDKQKTAKLNKLLSQQTGLKNQTVLITDDPEILSVAADAGLCAVFRDWNPDTSETDNKGAVLASEAVWRSRKKAAAVITDSSRDEDPEDEWFEMILDHYCSRAHVIAESSAAMIRLRESVPDDFDMVLRLEQDQDACLAGARSFGGTRQAFIAYIKQAYEFQGFGYWTVEEMKDVNHPPEPGNRRTAISGKAIGWAGFSPVSPALAKWAVSEGADKTDKSVLNLGYALLPEKRGQHLGEEAVRLCIRYGFKNLGADLIMAEVSENNLSSENLLRKLGFHENGRTHALKKDLSSGFISESFTRHIYILESFEYD